MMMMKSGRESGKESFKWFFPVNEEGPEEEGGQIHKRLLKKKNQN